MFYEIIDPEKYILFIGIIFLNGLIIGPSAILVMNTYLNSGIKSTLKIVWGMTLGNTLYAFLSAYGLAHFIINNNKIYLVLQCAGALFIAYLGLNILFSKNSFQQKISVKNKNLLFIGFLVILLDPIIIGIYLSFIPNFLNNTLALKPQIILYTITMVILFPIITLSYSLFGKGAKKFAFRYQKTVSQICAIVLIGFACKSLYEILIAK
ncbi:MAG: LysE family translocator [Silvanigrellaceae bacterium]|nr:LysE family translocator [Silvanigrellaceae bacterium]